MNADESRRRDALPPVTVARFEQVALLIERLSQEKTSVFLGAMASYSDQHRAATARPLTHLESAQVATAMANELGEEDVPKLAADIQQSALRASDRPETRELLLAAGTRTAPAFLDAALRVCALVEMPAETFEEALDEGDLDLAVEAACAELRRVPMLEARPRAAEALEHFVTQTTGGTPGEAWSLLTGTVLQALTEAISRIAASASSSSTDLLDPTDGAAATSSTG